MEGFSDNEVAWPLFNLCGGVFLVDEAGANENGGGIDLFETNDDGKVSGGKKRGRRGHANAWKNECGVFSPPPCSYSSRIFTHPGR